MQNNTSDIDKNGDIGTASNFTTEQYNDGVFDTLAEADTNNSSLEKYSYFNDNGDVWTNPSNAYDNGTGTAATYTWSTSGYTAYLTLNLTYVTRGSKIRYWVGRSSARDLNDGQMETSCRKVALFSIFPLIYHPFPSPILIRFLRSRPDSF